MNKEQFAVFVYFSSSFNYYTLIKFDNIVNLTIKSFSILTFKVLDLGCKH